MGITQAHEKCVMKIKERNKEKNDVRVKDFLMEGRNLYWCYTKLLQCI